jgi:hypothetical protein
MKFLLLSTLFFTRINSQFIDITICTDNNCNSNCISWTATNGECSTCRNGDCSISNPSVMIQNMNSITFYTDTKCLTQNIVPRTTANLISLDNTCHLLHDNNQNLNIIGSYHALNKSALIGGIIGSILLLIIIIACCSCSCYYYCKKRQTHIPQPNTIIIDEKSIEPVLPRPLSGYGYEYKPQQPNQNIYEPYVVAPVSIPPQQPIYQTYPSVIYVQQQYPQQYASQYIPQSSYYPPPVPSAPPSAQPSTPYVQNEPTQKYI